MVTWNARSPVIDAQTGGAKDTTWWTKRLVTFGFVCLLATRYRYVYCNIRHAGDSDSHLRCCFLSICSSTWFSDATVAAAFNGRCLTFAFSECIFLHSVIHRESSTESEWALSRHLPYCICRWSIHLGCHRDSSCDPRLLHLERAQTSVVRRHLFLTSSALGDALQSLFFVCILIRNSDNFTGML